MKTIKEVLRLKYLNKLSNRKIQTLLKVSRSTISNYCRTVDKSELTAKEVLELNDDKLHELFYPNVKSTIVQVSQVIEINFEIMHEELKKKGMTRALLWEEYAQAKRQSALGVHHK